MSGTPYIRHLRHRNYDRTRHSQRFNEWLDEQATRLGITAEEVFDLLKEGMSAVEVEQEPEPEPDPEPEPEE